MLYEKRFESRRINVVKQYDDDLEITALAGEIRQAFSNLITNAIDAMPEGGTLALRATKSREWSNSQVPGVRITVLDTGSGIEPRHRKNIFQPFFTTKSDVGTGLGLWITRGILEKHHGSIRMKSRTGQSGHGTAFSIFLPTKYAAGIPDASSSQARAQQLGLRRRPRLVKIIVVDDEPIIADTLVNILEGEGHDALAVSHGESAIRWAKMVLPDAVISDVIMPGMDGIETAKAIMKVLPQCRIILFSGQAASVDLLAKARAEGYIFEVLPKPINPDKLLEKLKD